MRVRNLSFALIAISLCGCEQIRDGWLQHTYSDENTPFRNADGTPENFLWVSNQRAHDLMRTEGMVPPATSDPENNTDYEMIDAQLTTEIFGLFAPTRPDVALEMAYLPIRTTAGATWEEARDAIYERYQVNEQDGYDISSRGLYCNGSAMRVSPIAWFVPEEIRKEALRRLDDEPRATYERFTRDRC